MTFTQNQDSTAIPLHWANANDAAIPKQAKDCLARIDWHNLCEYASRANSGQACTVLPAYSMGGTRLARLLKFEDGTIWVVRVQQQATKKPSTLSPTTETRHTNPIQTEVDTIALLRARTKTPVPRVFAFETGDDDPVGEPFVLFELLPGNTAMEEAENYEMGDWGVIPRQFRGTFYEALAKAHVQIASARLPQIGTVTRTPDGSFTVGPIPGLGGPFDTAASFIQAWSLRAICPFDERYLRETVPTPAEFIDEILQGARSLAPRMAELASSGKYFTAKGPFPIRHADFWHSNIIVESETFDVLGIIDWEGAITVPWELMDFPRFLSTVPRLLDPPGQYDQETGEPLDEDEIGRWKEKKEYVEMVRGAEEEAGVDHGLSDVLADGDMQDLAATFHLFLGGRVGFYGKVLEYLENK